MLHKINMSESLTQLEAVQKFTSHYQNMTVHHLIFNNYLLALLRLDSGDSSELSSIPDVTINDIHIEKKYQLYEIDLLFEKESMQFPGYPKIEYTKD